MGFLGSFAPPKSFVHLATSSSATLLLFYSLNFLWFFLFPKKERTKGVWGKAPLLRHGLQIRASGK
jgi:hypothetical protein